MTYQDIIKKALELGIQDIEIYAQKQSTQSINVYEKKLESCNSKDLFGMSLRGVYNGKMGYAYIETLEEEAVNLALVTLIENAKTITADKAVLMYDGQAEYEKVETPSCDASQISNSEKINVLKDLEKKAFEKDKRIVKVGHCAYNETKVETKIINSKGLDLERSHSYQSVVLNAIAQDGESIGDAYNFKAAFNLKDIDLDEIAEDCVAEATAALGAGFIETGKYEVVFNRDVATSLLQVFCNNFSAEAAIKKATLLTDKVGQKVFGENITITDDPFYEKGLIKYAFDDEGVPCHKKNIVENGVFKGFLHNLETASKFGVEPTGNGFKRGVASNVKVSPTNLYLAPGAGTKEDVIANCQKGILVTSVAGLHSGVNPISGSFNVQAKGFVIEDGKVGRPITLFVVSGNFYELYNNVLEIGGDLEDNSTGLSCPTLRIKELMISGK